MDLMKLNDEILFRICNHLDAISVARFASCNKELRRILDERIVAKWVANSDQWKDKWNKSDTCSKHPKEQEVRPDAKRKGGALHSSANINDIACRANKEDSWTLEKLHVIDDPPKFEPFRFPFGNARLVHQDNIADYHYLASRDVHNQHEPYIINNLFKIYDYMRTHESCTLVVNGFTQPDCPDAIALSISAERVRVVCQYIARMLICDILNIDPKAQSPGPLSAIPCFLKRDILMSDRGEMVLQSQWDFGEEKERRNASKAAVDAEGAGRTIGEARNELNNDDRHDSMMEAGMDPRFIELYGNPNLVWLDYDENETEGSESECSESEDDDDFDDDASSQDDDGTTNEMMAVAGDMTSDLYDSDNEKMTEFDPLLPQKGKKTYGHGWGKESPRKLIRLVESRFKMKAHGNSDPVFDFFNQMEMDEGHMFTRSDEGANQIKDFC